MKPLTEFLSEVLPHVQGCPVPVAINAIRNSVIEFVGRTGVFVQTLDVDLERGVNNYTLDVDSGTSPLVLLRGWRAGRAAEIVAVSPVRQDDNIGAAWRNESGGPNKAYIAGGLLYVAPVPTARETIEVDVSCTYSRSAQRIEDFICDRWFEEIARGALGRLMVIPGQPWTDMQSGVAYRSQFEIDINQAAIQVAKGGTTASLAAAPRRFG